MARTKTVNVNGVEYTLQSTNYTWYTGQVDRYISPIRGEKSTSTYTDNLIKACVMEPVEVAKRGIAYFNDTDDISTPAKLIREIESFLAE